MFGGKNINQTLERLSVLECTEQLSIVNVVCRFYLRNLLSNARTHSSNKTLSIQLFRCDLYEHGMICINNNLAFLKHWGFLDFSIRNVRSLSPSAFAAAIPVIHILYACYLSTFQTLSARFWSVIIDRRNQIRLYFICPLTCTGKEELVKKFHTMMLLSQVAPN